MTISKNTRMMQLLNHRLKMTLLDGRTFIGQLLAFDRHMNLVLADCQEYRKIKQSQTVDGQKVTKIIEEKRTLGFIILRGETVVSMVIESPPAVGDAKNRKPAGLQSMAPMAPGQVRPIARAIPPQVLPPGVRPGMMRPMMPPPPGRPLPNMAPMGMPPGYRPRPPPQ